MMHHSHQPHPHAHQVQMHPQQHPQVPPSHHQHNIQPPSVGPPPQQHNIHRDQNRMNHHHQQQRLGPQIHQPPPSSSSAGRPNAILHNGGIHQQHHHQQHQQQHQLKIHQHHHHQQQQQKQQTVQSIVPSTTGAATPSTTITYTLPQIVQPTVVSQSPRLIEAPTTTILTAATVTSTSSTSLQANNNVIIGGKIDISATEIPVKEQSSSSIIETLANIKEKTPMCLVNELARYNKIQHQYRLTGEQGPAHKKRFTVTLKLGDEEYTSDGHSIKKAQHAAASEAIVKTKYNHPPAKTIRTPIRNQNAKSSSTSSSSHSPGFYDNGNITPTVELNALAMKRGEPAVYLVEHPHSNNVNNNILSGPIITNGGSGITTTPAISALPSTSHSTQPQQQNQYLSNNAYNNVNHQHQVNQYGNFHPRNNNHNNNGNGNIIYQQQRYNNYERRNIVRKFDYEKRYMNANNYMNGSANEDYHITLQVGQRKFVGIGHTLQAARHDAASKALDILKSITNETQINNDNSLTNNNNNNNKNNNNMDDTHSELKSPISVVHEMALKRNMSVTFEVQSEKGPPHMKTFITTCRVGPSVTEGEGNGKKLSKKRAAEKMLDELKTLPPPSPTQRIAKPKRKAQVPMKKKSRNLIKEKSEPDYPEDVNPISRLIQIQQSRKEKEPTYTLIEERGAPRRREFVMEVFASGQTAQGTGPNKKLAKRMAAENILIAFGMKAITGGSQSKENIIKVITPPPPPPPTEIVEKARKVTFQEITETVRSPTPTNLGGSCGRQLVPGVLLVQQENKGGFITPSKSGISQQQTATIAKELLNAGTSPTADAIVKSANHNQKLGDKQSPIVVKNTCEGVRPKDQLLYLAQLLEFQVNFADFPKGNHGEYLTLVTLTTDPPQLCHGNGNSTDASHDQAAMTALKMLSDLGLDNVKKPIKTNIKPKPILSNGLKKI